MDLDQYFHREPVSDRGISVVIPVYNEAECLESVVGGITQALERLGRGFEVIVVNDGSADGTRAVAERMASLSRRIRLIHHDTNLGYGAALKSGFELAKYPLVLQMDGDGQYPAAEIEKLLS